MPLRLPQRSKYGSVRTTVDGVTFDSKKEAGRYGELKLLLRAGEICQLVLQPEFPLYAQCDLPLDPERDPLKLGIYRGDFQYVLTKNGEVIVEDVKSPATRKKQIYVWKKKHFQRQYQMEIREV
jgi:hypothetical protein